VTELKNKLLASISVESRGYSTPCWIWQRSRNNRDYGTLTYNSRSLMAHRASYIVEFGPIPEGLFACHACDVECCIRPDHIWLGTPAQNQRDRREKEARKKQKETVKRAHGIAFPSTANGEART
jgi:hypothetical protein